MKPQKLIGKICAAVENNSTLAQTIAATPPDTLFEMTIKWPKQEITKVELLKTSGGPDVMLISNRTGDTARATQDQKIIDPMVVQYGLAYDSPIFFDLTEQDRTYVVLSEHKHW
jgi:hypothetical protein